MPVDEAPTAAVQGLEKWNERGGRRYILHLVGLVPDCVQAVGGQVGHRLPFAVGPGDGRGGAVGFSQSKMPDGFNRRQIPPHRIRFLHQNLAVGSSQAERGTQPVAVGNLALEFDAEPVRNDGFNAGGPGCANPVVAVESRFAIDVVEDQVQIAVVIQIRVGRAVGIRFFIQAPGQGFILKRQIARLVATPVSEDVIVQFVFGQLIQFL